MADPRSLTSVVVVTGTGTEVGKTIATAALAAVVHERGSSVAVVKPAQTGLLPGQPGDVDEVRRLVGDDVATHELVRLRDLIDEARQLTDRRSEQLRVNRYHAGLWDELVNLGKKITDYDTQDDDEEMGGDGAGGDGPENDETQGVAVVFDEDEDDEDGPQTYEVRDEDTDDEEDEEENGRLASDPTIS